MRHKRDGNEFTRALVAILVGVLAAVAVVNLDTDAIIIHEEAPTAVLFRPVSAPSKLKAATSASFDSTRSGTDEFNALERVETHHTYPRSPLTFHTMLQVTHLGQDGMARKKATNWAAKAKRVSLITDADAKEAALAAKHRAEKLIEAEAERRANALLKQWRQEDIAQQAKEAQIDENNAQKQLQQKTVVVVKPSAPTVQIEAVPDGKPGIVDLMKKASALVATAILRQHNVSIQAPALPRAKTVSKAVTKALLKENSKQPAEPKDESTKATKAPASKAAKGSGNIEIRKLLKESASPFHYDDIDASVNKEATEIEHHSNGEFKALLKHPNAAAAQIDSSHKGESIVRFLNQEKRALRRTAETKGAKAAKVITVKEVLENELAVEAAPAQVMQLSTPVEDAVAEPFDGEAEDTAAPATGISAKKVVKSRKPEHEENDTTVNDSDQAFNEFINGSDDEDENVNQNETVEENQQAVEAVKAMKGLDVNVPQAKPEEPQALIHDPLEKQIQSKRNEDEIAKEQRVAGQDAAGRALDSLLHVGEEAR